MEKNQALEIKEESEVVATNLKASDKPKITPFFGLLENSFNSWRKNLKMFINIFLWGAYYSLIPALVMIAVMVISVATKNSLGLGLSLLLMLVSLAGMVMIIYFSIQAYLGIFMFVKKDYQGSAKESFKEAKPLIGSYFWLSILTVVLILLWTLLLIIPGIIFSIFYSFAVYAFVFEGKKGMAAIRRSKELVKNYWWPVAGRVLAFSFLILLFSEVIAMPLDMVEKYSLWWHIWNAIFQIIGFIIGPIALLFSYKIYQDLVNIKK